MALNKFSTKSDAVANLYRASFFLAKGQRKIGLDLLTMAQKELGDRIKVDKNKPDRILAERLLDFYQVLK
jgi:hypothetical protein